MGFALLEAGRFKKALAAFTRAARLDPGSGQVHRERAEALQSLGLPKRALAAADRAAGMDPGDPAVHIVRGAALYGLGRAGVGDAGRSASFLRPAHPYQTPCLRLEEKPAGLRASSGRAHGGGLRARITG